MPVEDDQRLRADDDEAGERIERRVAAERTETTPEQDEERRMGRG
jgi:hypothetical protein